MKVFRNTTFSKSFRTVSTSLRPNVFLKHCCILVSTLSNRLWMNAPNFATTSTVKTLSMWHQVSSAWPWVDLRTTSIQWMTFGGKSTNYQRSSGLCLHGVRLNTTQSKRVDSLNWTKRNYACKYLRFSSLLFKNNASNRKIMPTVLTWIMPQEILRNDWW